MFTCLPKKKNFIVCFWKSAVSQLKTGFSIVTSLSELFIWIFLTIFDYFVEELENVKYLRFFYDEGNPQPLSFETDIEDSYSHPTSFEEALFGWFVVPLMLYLNSVLSVLIEHFCFNAAC